MAPSLGLIDEGQRAGGPGLGLAAPTPLAAPGVQPGQAPREVDTAGAAARARATSTPASQNAAPAKPKSNIPKFSDDPLRSIAFALSEGALAFAGLPTRLPGLLAQESEDDRAAQGRAMQEQGLKLRQTAATLDAVKFGVTQIKAAPEKRDEIIASIAGIEGLAGAEDVLRAMSRPGTDTDAVLSIMEESPEATAGMADLIRKGLVTPEEGVDFLAGLATKKAEADLEVDTALAKQEALAAGKARDAFNKARAEADAKGDPTQVVQTRDEAGNELDVLINSKTGQKIAEIGRGPTRIRQENVTVPPGELAPIDVPLPARPTSDFDLATGGSGVFGGIVNTLSDAFGLGLAFPRVEEAKRDLIDLQVQTKLILAAEIPGRPSNLVREELAKLSVTPGSLLEGDAAARKNLEQTRDFISKEVARMQNLLQSPAGLTAGDISSLRINLSQAVPLLQTYTAITENIKPLTAGEQKRLERHRKERKK